MTRLILHILVKQNERRAENLPFLAEHFMRNKLKMEEVGNPKTEEEKSPGRSPQDHRLQWTNESEGVGVKM